MTEEDFDDWKDNPVTQQFMSWVGEVIGKCEDAWGKAINGGVPDGQLPMLRARLSECARLANQVIDVSYEDLDDDEEHERDSSD